MKMNIRDYTAILRSCKQPDHLKGARLNKIYYETVNEGTGTWQVLPTESCYFHCTITTLDGVEIQNTHTNNKPKKICLAEVIPGFSRGVIGMKKSERRKLYIHPDFAYRKVGWKVPPQTLLIIDVELCEPT